MVLKHFIERIKPGACGRLMCFEGCIRESFAIGRYINYLILELMPVLTGISSSRSHQHSNVDVYLSNGIRVWN